MISHCATQVRNFAGDIYNVLIVTLVAGTVLAVVVELELFTAAAVLGATTAMSIYALIRMHIREEVKWIAEQRAEHQRFIAECKRAREQLAKSHPESRDGPVAVPSRARKPIRRPPPTPGDRAVYLRRVPRNARGGRSRWRHRGLLLCPLADQVRYACTQSGVGYTEMQPFVQLATGDKFRCRGVKLN